LTRDVFGYKIDSRYLGPKMALVIVFKTFILLLLGRKMPTFPEEERPLFEKRKPRRYPVEGMGIYARTMFNTTVEVLELSLSGALIKGARGMLIGCKYNFKIEHGDKVIPVDGVVVWEKTSTEKVTGGEAMAVYTAGIEFLDVRTNKAEHLKELIADKVRELKDRRLSGIRVKVSPPEKAVLSYMERCEIRDISVGGMRIEIEQEPHVDTIFSFELILTKTAAPVHCKGRIAFYHRVPEKIPKKYYAGVEFPEISGVDRSILEKFVETLLP
jgi:c-di-GMP-binding flagellar brake protein YcgR